MKNRLIGRGSGGARAKARGWTAGLCGALALSLLPLTAQGGHLSEYTYTVLRDGDPIGTHRVTVLPNGEDVKVSSETSVEVGFGPLTVYRMEHLRHELWRDGELEMMTAHTDKNGDIYDIAITREPDGYTRVINGRTDKFQSSMKLLTLWHKDLFKYNSFVSPMEDRTYDISVNFVGTDKVELINRSVDAFAYRMSGDTNRELWYDAEGHVVKVRLLDHDTAIEYVLDTMAGETGGLAENGRVDPDPNGPDAPRLAARR